MSGSVDNSFMKPFFNPPGVPQTSGLQTSGTPTSGKDTSTAAGTDDDASFKASGAGSAESGKKNFGPAGNKRIDDA